MAESSPELHVDSRAAFREYERGVRIHNYRVACVLALVFMPVGGVLDWFVFRRDQPQLIGHFFQLRLLCSALLLFIWWFVRTPLGLKYLRALGQIVAALPSFFISWMIFETDGARSHYYAGINLVLLGAALVLRWTLLDSILVVLTALGMYMTACALCNHVSLSEAWNDGTFFNNLYFLFVTGIFVIIGNFFYNRLRFSEWEARAALDRNRKALQESNQKLLELDQIKSRFFANISHELRTPLTLLLAPLEKLLERFRASVDAETRELLVGMHSNGMRLLKLINDLLDLVRLESGRMEVKQEPIAMEELVKGLASAARQVAEDKRLTLETYADPALGTILGDRDKLDKIVLNLLFNALKFTPAGGRVELRAERQEDRFSLAVSDTGMGISEKNLQHIFNRFWQADSSSRRKYQGVGIGLALVKELVEIQGGKVAVESLEGRGTTFTVTLPYRAALAAEKAPATTAQEESEEEDSETCTVTSEEWLANLYRRAELFPALAPVQAALKPIEISRNSNHPTILVADDEPDMLRFLKAQLAPNYNVIEAVDGQQAIEKAFHLLPDLVVLDMMMPEKDGLQVCRELRENTPTQSIPVILLTARADEETKLAALSAGASDFLAKPFSTTELHVRIKNLVQSFQYQRKLSKQNLALESTIDQLKETETQLVQSEKLASLGRMSAGIIHEINNPLNFATTGLFTLRNKGKLLAPEQQQDFLEILKDVEDGITRVKTIVGDLRTFTHPDTESRDQVEIAEVLNSALRFLHNGSEGKVQILQEIPEHLTVWANRNKLEQVLLNLLHNAIDALNDKQFDAGKATIWIRGQVRDRRTLLSIRDNGTGIKPEHLDKIFDPFFTTKEVGAGVGLGLSICYRIVQEFEGRISAATELGKFTEFTLEFPVKG